ncbi:MAG: hypothetical protein R3B45_15420 [Bdellovibrionota bacterium]
MKGLNSLKLIALILMYSIFANCQAKKESDVSGIITTDNKGLTSKQRKILNSILTATRVERVRDDIERYWRVYDDDKLDPLVSAWQPHYWGQSVINA